MRIHLLAVGKRMPPWVDAAYGEYAQRLPPQCSLRLTEIAASRRTAGANLERLLHTEGEKLLAAIPAGAHVVALERTGRQRSSEEWARALQGFLAQGRDLALLIGGPEGLAPDCLKRAHELWSLSALTLPHALVRVVVAEQLYRAWSMLNHLPYHR